MARPLRLEFAGAIWYVVGKAAPRKEVFRDDEDRAEFLSMLGRTVAMLRWKIHSYSLLRTQFRLVIETPEPNLSRGMRQINGVYTQYCNRKYGRAGALLHGRYKSVLVEKDAHLLELVRNVAWSPVAEKLARNLSDWKWTSYRPTAGLSSGPEWLESGAILGELAKSPKKAQERFRKFVSDGKDADYDPMKHVIGQLFLGSEQFRDQCMKTASGRAGAAKATPKVTGIARPKLREILVATAEVFGTTEKDLKKNKRGPARKVAAFLARREGAHKLPEIGEALGIREFSASHLAAEGERLYDSDAAFRRKADKVRQRLGVS